MRLEFGRDTLAFGWIRLQNVGQRARGALRPASPTRRICFPVCVYKHLLCLAASGQRASCARVASFYKLFRAHSLLPAMGTNQIQSGSSLEKSSDVITGWRSNGADPVAVVVT